LETVALMLTVPVVDWPKQTAAWTIINMASRNILGRVR